MKIFYCETGVGCCLVRASTAESARNKMEKKVGTLAGVSLTREATEADLAWVRGFGGVIHE